MFYNTDLVILATPRLWQWGASGLSLFLTTTLYLAVTSHSLNAKPLHSLTPSHLKCTLSGLSPAGRDKVCAHLMLIPISKTVSLDSFSTGHEHVKNQPYYLSSKICFLFLLYSKISFEYKYVAFLHIYVLAISALLL